MGTDPFKIQIFVLDCGDKIQHQIQNKLNEILNTNPTDKFCGRAQFRTIIIKLPNITTMLHDKLCTYTRQ